MSRVAGALFLLLVCAGVVFGLTACEPDYREAGRKAGDLVNEAETRAALDPTTAAAQRATDAARVQEVGGTVAAEVEERAPTVAAEVEERAPTVAAGAATAVQEFSEGVEESGACNGAALILVFVGLIVSTRPRRGT